MAFIQKETVRQLIADLAGLPVGAVIYNPDEPEPIIGEIELARIFLEVNATGNIGWDNTHLTFDVGLNKQIVTSTGAREFILEILMESFDPTVNAYLTLENIRTKVFRRTSRARLLADDMTVSTAEQTVKLPTHYDNRVISAASLDLHMLSTDRSEDDTESGNWIETFTVTSDVDP